MNPFKVQKIINESCSNGKRLIIEQLSEKCGVKFRHAHFIMSEDMFESDVCHGFPRHWVKSVSPFGWLTLWTYKPPKQTDFSPAVEPQNLKSFAELKSLSEKVETEKINEE